MATVFNALARIQHLRLPDAARSLASAGVPVFPCVPGEKRRLTRRGFRDATTDLDQVSKWWDRWPSANLAIPTGPVSGIEVVDIDIGSTGSGFPAFQRARREGLMYGWAALVRTPSGGLHVYFPADGSRDQFCRQSSKMQIDLSASGGYFLPQPSQVSRPRGRLGPSELQRTGVAGVSPVHASRLRNFLDPRPIFADKEPVSLGRDVDVERI